MGNGNPLASGRGKTKTTETGQPQPDEPTDNGRARKNSHHHGGRSKSKPNQMDRQRTGVDLTRDLPRAQAQKARAFRCRSLLLRACPVEKKSTAGIADRYTQPGGATANRRGQTKTETGREMKRRDGSRFDPRPSACSGTKSACLPLPVAFATSVPGGKKVNGRDSRPIHTARRSDRQPKGADQNRDRQGDETT